MNEKYLRKHKEEINESSADITPICILVDKSHSMADGKFRDKDGKTRIERLNDGIATFISDIKKDDALYDSVEIAIVTFDISANVVQPFMTIPNMGNVSISAGKHTGDTPAGVEYALNLLSEEKEFLGSSKRGYKQPWIVIMSDGRATPAKDPVTGTRDYADINRRLQKVQRETKELESNKKLTVIPVLISEKSDGQYYEARKQMRGFTIQNRCHEIGSGDGQTTFKDFFKIFEKSVSIGNAELMFSGNGASAANVNSIPRPTKDDYVNAGGAKREEVAKAPRHAETEIKISTPTPTPTPTPVAKDDNLDEVLRMQAEAAKVVTEPTKTASPDPVADYEKEAEELAAPTPVATPTVTKTEDADEAYIDDILANLPDWDSI